METSLLWLQRPGTRFPAQNGEQMKRFLLSGILLCLGLVCLSQQPRAQFNGCQAGFCTKSVAVAQVVAFDAFATAGANVTGTTIGLTTQTVGVGSNRALVAGLSIQAQASAASVTCSWDSAGTPQPMSLITSVNVNGATGTMQLWGLVNPTSGNKTLTCSWTGSNQIGIASAAFTGVNQAGGTTSFPNSATGSGASGPTLNVTNVTNGIVVDLVGSSAVVSAPTQTIMTPINNSPAIGLGMSRSSAAGAVTFAWTAAGNWGQVGTAISP